MKKILLLGATLSWLAIAAQTDYPIKGVSFSRVHLKDQFWLPRLELNRTVSIPAALEQCRLTGRLRNFEMAAAKKESFVPSIRSTIRTCTKPLKELPIPWPLIPTRIWKTYWIH